MQSIYLTVSNSKNMRLKKSRQLFVTCDNRCVRTIANKNFGTTLLHSQAKKLADD